MYYNKFTVVHNTMRNLHMCKFTVYVDQEVCLVSKGLFENMNDELRNLSREMGAIEEFKGNVKDVEEVIENINSPLTIMVMGEFSTGKSTFINALMGEPITKVDAKPTTAVITKLVYGERDRIVVHYQDGTQQEYSREEFARLTAEADEEANEMHNRMDYVERTLPIDMLKSMSIIDSPGLNSIKSVHEDMTRHFMDKADTVLWMFDANKPGSQTEIDALKRLNPRLSPLVLVNKIDGIDEEEGDSVEGILEGVERRLENNKIEAQGYLGISAKMAFKGKTENRDNLVQASNIGAFYDAIEEKVLPGREQYKRNSLLDGLVKMSYGVGSHIKELREKNEERKGSDYAAYVAMETELATVWDELENITDIMLTDIEKNQPQGRKRLNAAMKAFYGMIHWLGIFVEQDDDVARKYLEEAAVRGDEEAQRVLTECLWYSGKEEEAEYWVEQIGIENLPQMHQAFGHKGEKFEESKDYDNALKYFLILAEAGDADAMAEIGVLYSKEEWINYDYNKAKEWYIKAFNKGMNEAGAMIGLIYMNGQGVAQDLSEALKWFRLAVKVGSSFAMMCLGDMYAEGKGVNQNCIEAMQWYKKAINAGCDMAKEHLGDLGIYLYDQGKYEEALNYLKEASNVGDVHAPVWIGKMYEKGEGVNQDYSEAMHWYMKAANMGNSAAMNNIGLMYHFGVGVDKDYTCARNWYKKAISTGYDDGTSNENLSFLERDEGVELYGQGKYEEAISCFESAADKGNSSAMSYLGKMYEDGKGVSQDYRKAMQWYIKAANMGDPIAMNNIGLMYHMGKGVGKDYTCASNWYKKAISAGDDDGVSKKNLEILEEEIRRYAQEPRKQQSSGCFITTATCDNFGKPDNCYELNTFRTFRDNWLSCQPDGPALISEYYDVAPAIVEKIDSLSNAKEVYVVLCQDLKQIKMRTFQRQTNICFLSNVCAVA